MDKNDLINKLNWFYSLELNQVGFYTSQSKDVNDIYIRKVLERVASVEQQHVNNIADFIKELGGKPTVVGDLLAPVSGRIAGKISGWAGIITMLKININLEQKAMADYKNLIVRVGDKDLFDLLWANLVDEDLHAAWFSNKVKELEALEVE
ncbi:ferritin-like domain-containing protein [Calderihabitans maritimus]|uniref:Ferritin/DPS domain-containing protein n=1 Tax=Calderihabitans maritimus TaxID=1246530 RepID=A0A1Z5HNU5_9FIRM|nr:ferritin-like domain-containing protein [Calderihabitans maritimus]GAW90930.1 hypothetical protein KKC1_00920 [Calderihabitans maritimus]